MPRFQLRFRFQLQTILLIALVLISGLMLGLSTGGFLINFNEVGYSVFSSMQRGVHTTSSTVGDAFTTLQELRMIREENERLTLKIQDFEKLQLNQAELLSENIRLKDLLDLSEAYTKTNIPAQIIGRQPDNISTSITINKGTKHGIRKNMPVIAYQNGQIGLVGKIIEVGQSTSMFMPLYDFQFNVSARLQETKDLGLVSGLGTSDGTIVMRYIPKRVFPELSRETLVVTSGENENYEKDIPIGKIAKITIHEYDSSLEIELDPIINFSRLDTVIVVDLQLAKD